MGWIYLTSRLLEELFFLIFLDLRREDDRSDLEDELSDEGVLDLFLLFSLSFLLDDLLSPISYNLIDNIPNKMSK